MRRKVLVTLFCLAFSVCVIACGNETSTESTETSGIVEDETERKETAVQEEFVSKEKNIFESPIKVTNYGEISEHIEEFDANSIQSIHLDDMMLTSDEFALTNKDYYEEVIEKVCKGREYDENIAGDIKIYFSDFILEYIRTYRNGEFAGVSVEVEARGEECNGFYIECVDGNWHIKDNFLVYSDYLEYQNEIDLMSIKMDIDESKLIGDGLVGIWYGLESDWGNSLDGAMIFYNDNTGVDFLRCGLICKPFTYEIQDDTHIYIKYNASEGAVKEYRLEGNKWIYNYLNDSWNTYIKIK